MKWTVIAAVVLGGLGAGQSPAARAADDDREIVAGEFQMTAPEGWERRKPKSRIVEQEFAALPSDGDENEGRVTMMFSGGTIDDNVARWRGQFSEIDGDSPDEPTERKVAGQAVTVVDIMGTFVEMGTGVERENYRMLGAIIELEEGNYFVKFVGPRRTVTDNEEGFQSLLDSLRAK